MTDREATVVFGLFMFLNINWISKPALCLNCVTGKPIILNLVNY